MTPPISRPTLTAADLYRPPAQAVSPVNRLTLQRRGGRVVDGWTEEGELVQVWQDNNSRHYLGIADAPYKAPAFWPVEIEE